MVVAARLEGQLGTRRCIAFAVKFGSATVNMNAHYVSDPTVDWNQFAEESCQYVGLVLSYPSTQIEHYDFLAALFDNVKRINTILIDFSRDMWQYISMEY